MRHGLFKAIGSALDGLDVAFCAFDSSDRTVAWNRTFLEFFPEHAGFVHAGEVYAENLRRFYRGRLQADELGSIEQYVDEGIKRHREQRRPYEFDHRGRRIRVSSVEVGLLGRLRVWRQTGSAENQAVRRITSPGPRSEPGEASFLDRLPDGILLVDSGDRITWANPAFLSLYGLPRIETALTRRFEDIYREVWSLAPHDPRFVESSRTLRENQRFSGAPFELALPDRRWVRVIEQREAAADGTGYFVHVDITQLKRQEAALRAAEASSRESEARVRDVTDHVPIVITEWSLDERVVFANKVACDLFDIPQASAPGMTLTEVRGVEARAFLQPYLTAVRNGEKIDFESVVNLNGSVHCFQQSYVPAFSSDGSVRGFYSVAVDVTKRMEVEQALRASRELLTRTGRLAEVGGWELDLATNAVRWTDEVRRIHEVAQHYAPTLETALAFYGAEAQAVLKDAMARSIETRSRWHAELPLTTATGRSIWIHTAGDVEFSADGVPTRLVGAIQDVTARKQLEVRLEANERFVRDITDNLLVRVSYIDRDGRYRFVNRMHLERFGKSRDQVLGRTPTELTSGSSDPQIAPFFDAALEGKAQTFEYDESGAGKARRIECQLVPDLDSDGRVRGVFATGVDITERKAAERALRELAEIFDSTPDFVVQTDWRGRMTYVNPAAWKVMGFEDGARLIGANFSDFNTPETNDRFITEITPHAKATGVWVGETEVALRPDRVTPVSHMVIAHRDQDGRVARYSALMRDISDQVAAREALFRQTETLRSMTEAIPAMVAVVGSDRRYRFVNSAFERWIARPRDAIVGQLVSSILGRDDYEKSRVWIERVLAGETVTFERDFVRDRVQGHLAVSYTPLRVSKGNVDGFVALLQDITTHKREAGRLLKLAERDSLTGLLNRKGFESYVDSCGGGDATGLALLYIDLDHFKAINDTHGHPVGDKLLRALADRLLRLVRPSDAVARLGGDEFAIVLTGIHERLNAELVADKVIKAAAEPFELDGLSLRIGASVGLGLDAGAGRDAWVAQADAALYRAKASGRGRHA